MKTGVARKILDRVGSFFSQHSAPSPQYALLAAFLWLPSLGAANDAVRFLNPDGIFKPSTFSQIAITRGDRVVYISGQTARNADASIVAVGDVRKQAEKVFDNLRIAVEAAGGSMGDIAKITTFVVDLKPDDRVWIGEMVKKHFPQPPAHTLVGISALAAPELLIEIEATAILD
ncbi:MAG TPA: RidA family protein [Burkholderiales bacterium]|nr:RidA family protein [Burkholderiales bacterium]